MTTQNNVNHVDEFDPMAESSFKPEIISQDKFNEIKENESKIIEFNKKFSFIRAKYEATFVDGIASENDWTKEDSALYENYKKEQKELPADWNTNLYQVRL